jgi:PiT family inorganic phosphate transporter
LVLAIAFGLFMAWGVGANDVANAMGTSVGSGAITIKQ